MLTPDRIAEPYRLRVQLGILTPDEFLEAMHRSFNAGTLATEHKVVEVADRYRAQLAEKQREIDRLTAGTPAQTANQGNE